MVQTCVPDSKNAKPKQIARYHNRSIQPISFYSGEGETTKVLTSYWTLRPGRSGSKEIFLGTAGNV
jgi:hypothetical protein